MVADEPVVAEAHEISDGHHQMLRATEYQAMKQQEPLPPSEGLTWAQWQEALRVQRGMG